MKIESRSKQYLTGLEKPELSLLLQKVCTNIHFNELSFHISMFVPGLLKWER